MGDKAKDGSRLGGFIDRGGRMLVGLLVVGALGGAALGYRPLERRVAELRSSDPAIEFLWPARADVGERDTRDEEKTWLPPSEREALRRLAAMSISRDPFDDASLAEAHHALRSTGWFESGPTVRRTPRGKVEVSGVWRVPAAVVRQGGKDRLVTRDGKLLKLEYPEGGAGTLRVISGVWAEPPRSTTTGGFAYGEPWLGGDVQAALALLDKLRTSPAWVYVIGVDTRHYQRNGHLIVASSGGGEIVWGAAPGVKAPGEQPEEVKLARLTALLTNAQWIRDGRPTAELYTPVVMVQTTRAGD